MKGSGWTPNVSDVSARNHQKSPAIACQRCVPTNDYNMATLAAKVAIADTRSPVFLSGTHTISATLSLCPFSFSLSLSLAIYISIYVRSANFIRPSRFHLRRRFSPQHSHRLSSLWTRSLADVVRDRDFTFEQRQDFTTSCS